MWSLLGGKIGCQEQPRKLDYNNGFVLQLTDIQYR